MLGELLARHIHAEPVITSTLIFRKKSTKTTRAGVHASSHYYALWMVGGSNLYAVLLLLHIRTASSIVAVTGSTGKLGRIVIQRLSNANIPTRILVRHSTSEETPSMAPEASPAAVVAYLAGLPGVECVAGDITDSASAHELLRGCSAVLALHGARRRTQLKDLLPWVDETTDPTHSKQVNYVGVQNLIAAAKASGTCRRIVRITGKGESPWSIFSILINGLGSMAKAWNFEGEGLLRGCSDVDYTIIRPGVMGRIDELDEGQALGLADNGGELKVSSIPHAAIADLAIECLQYPNAARATLCAMAVPSDEGAASYAPLLAKVKPDSRAFAPSLLPKHLQAVRVGGTAISAALLGGGVLLIRLAAAVAAALLHLVR